VHPDVVRLEWDCRLIELAFEQEREVVSGVVVDHELDGAIGSSSKKRDVDLGDWR
jgi:hypothetical protein